jgi:hypothetical protein
MARKSSELKLLAMHYLKNLIGLNYHWAKLDDAKKHLKSEALYLSDNWRFTELTTQLLPLQVIRRSDRKELSLFYTFS